MQGWTAGRLGIGFTFATFATMEALSRLGALGHVLGIARLYEQILWICGCLGD